MGQKDTKNKKKTQTHKRPKGVQKVQKRKEFIFNMGWNSPRWFFTAQMHSDDIHVTCAIIEPSLDSSIEKYPYFVCFTPLQKPSPVNM